MPDGIVCSPMREEAVAAGEEEPADDRGVAPFEPRPAGRAAASPLRIVSGVEQRPGDQEAHRRPGQGRDRLDDHADGEVRRAPDDVEGDEGDRDADLGGRREGRRRVETTCPAGWHPGRSGAGAFRTSALRAACDNQGTMRLDDRFDDLVTSLGGFYRAWVIQLGLELDLFAALRAAGAGGPDARRARRRDRHGARTRSRPGAAPRTRATSSRWTTSGSTSTR